MLEGIRDMALVLLAYIGLYTIPVMVMVLGAGFLIWIIKH